MLLLLLLLLLPPLLLLLLLLLLPPPPPPPPPPLPPLTMRHRAQPYRAPASSSHASTLEMDSLTRRYRRPSPPCARAIV